MTTKRLQVLSQHIASLPSLPTLAPEAFREASEAIEALVHDICAMGPDTVLDGSALVILAKDLRRIGDPSASEAVAGHLAEASLEAGRPRDAAQFLKIGGLARADQAFFPSAVTMFERALEVLSGNDPDFETVAILNNLGNALTELEQYDEAHTAYRRAKKLLDEVSRAAFLAARGDEPESVRGTVINNIGWSLMRQGRTMGRDHDLLMQAIRAFREVLQGPVRPRTRIIATGNLAEACLLRGEIPTAERLLQPLEPECVELRLERLLPEVYRRRAQLSATQGEVENAMFWTRKALQSSLTFTSPRQEIRVIEVCFDLLKDLLATEGDRMTGLERSGARVLDELIDLLESKDAYTGGDHSRRVAKLSRRLTAHLDDVPGGDERHLKTVELGGLLHDIGKLMIPWSLLNRLRPLQPKERELLHQHAPAGERLLMDIGLPELARVAGEHHERPDGTGYPRGRTDLSIDGAVVAVADAYEAMTSPSRRYRLPMRPKSAVAEVLAASGRQFVPLAAQALEAVVLRRPGPPA